jgi:putative oxidoreductase
MVRLRPAAVWAGAIFLALVFVAVGISKIEGASAARWAARFRDWGYPPNARYVVGVFEILAGVAVLIPRWRRAASLILGTLMMCALCTHLVNGEYPRIIPPLILGGLVFLTYRAHRGRAEERTVTENHSVAP